MIYIFYALLSTFSAYSNTGLQGCGVYSFSGTVIAEKRSFSIIVNKDTYSEQKIVLDEADAIAVMPFFKRSFKGKITITAFDGTRLNGKNPTGLELAPTNIITAQNDKITLLEKKECEK